RKAYEDNKNKKLVVLAASLDMNEEDWIKAMKEDNLTWPSLLMPYEEIKAMNTMYNVQGIPLILLIDPNGRIIERDMRGPRIYEAVAEYVK
ncbi:peroxiredoxin family protein, partial [Porphyromonas cangingivalis]